ncbi:MAG: PKD domain containing protein [Streptosporangiales bacterium]|nr:PKD domain containing protein [Streptosporangiales bacterium]
MSSPLSRMSRFLTAAAVVAAALVLSPAAPASAAADPVTHGGIVSADPADFTPHVQDGDVHAIVRIGDRIVVGGNFTAVRLPGGTDVPRGNAFAFDADTGALDTSFTPAVDGEVSVLVPSADGESVYLGGRFVNVNGVRSKSLARLRLADGRRVPGFTVPALDGVIKDMKLASGRLYIGGVFNNVASATANRTGLAALDPDTGALGAFLNVKLTGTHQPGDVNIGVWKMDVSPDGARMVLIGNFDQADGLKREQFAVLDLSGGTAAVADVYTPRYEPGCSSSFDTYMRDVAFAPDGSYYVVVTTGAYSAGTLCDTAARFETDASGTAVQPTWVNYTGGDTLTAVAISGPVVYLGGHQRWLNNPFCADRACQGAVERSGIAAVDPANGMTFGWNPGKDRGVAVYDLTVTPDGLWVGSDTEQFAGETHRRLAFLPLAGGGPLPAYVPGELPGEVYTAGAGTDPADRLRRRTFDGSTAGTPDELTTTGLDWRTARGAFMLGGTLYHGSADGELYRRTFDGTTAGAPTKIDTADRLVRMSDWHTRLASVRGMFYADGRIYYTAGTSALYYRYFNPESDTVGAQEWQAAGDLPGLAWSGVAGMFAHDGKLYSVDEATGRLRRTDFVDGVPVGGTTVQVDAGDWRGRAVFLNAGRTAPDPIAYRAGAGYNANTLRATVTVPSEVEAGDGMLLFGTVNSTAVTVTPPAGWTQVGTATTGGATSTVWRREATASDAGSEVAVAVSAFAKVDLRLAAYDGTAAGSPVVESASFVDPAVTTAHRTPEVAVGAGGRWAVSYWADKSSSTTLWTAPAGVTVRSTAIGAGSGRVSTLLADSAGPVPTGTYGGLTATTDAASRGLMWTVLLGPA